jgi:hypothetical protein
MGLITCQHSTSIDGFIAEAHGRSDRLQAWLRAGNDITAQHRHPLPGGGHRNGGRGLLVKRQIVAWRPDENLYGNKIYTNQG